VTNDNRTLVVSNRVAGSISIYSIFPSNQEPLRFRSTFSGCPGATDVAVQTDTAGGGKAFVACSGGHQVMVVSLAAAPGSWRATQDPSLLHDALLTLLDVGKTPTSLTLKPDGGEIFATNFDSGTVSEISTWTNEVSSTFPVGAKPTRAVISRDNTSMWISNFGADAAVLYSIADGRVVAGIHTGAAPDALAFSADEHLLLVADSGTGDITAIRAVDRRGSPSLFTLFPAGGHPNDIVVRANGQK
jgi:YVTN family beta-propeller protein